MLGSPGVSKSKLPISSESLEEVMWMGKPDCKVQIPASAHPLTRWLVQFVTGIAGIRQYSLTTNRCAAWNKDKDRSFSGFSGSTEFSKLEALSIDLLQVYDARSSRPCENRRFTSAWNEL